MSRAKLMVKTCFAMAAALLFTGCITNNDNAPRIVAGAHPKDWLPTHWSEYAKSPDQCSTCHGSLSDPATAGGIAKVSCFTCHPKGPGHPAGWEAGLQHGRAAAQAAPGTKTGFAYCFKCHGNNVSAGLTATSCLACHTKAPHPDRPWTGDSLQKSNHTQTNTGNAAECAKCHLGGANSTMKPLTNMPATTTPGCFNETLCHGTDIHR